MMRKRGFTFIEMILAVTIFSIIAVSIYSVFRVGTQLWLRTSPMIEANQSFRFFFNTISSDLKNAVLYSKKCTDFEGENQRISFMTLVEVSGPGMLPHTELARVIYYFDKSNKTIKRAVSTRLEGFSENTNGTDILNNIENKDFGIEYCYKSGFSPTEYDYEWKKIWQEDEDKEKSAGKIPRGVKVKAGEYEKTIFIPTGELGTEK